MLSIILVFIGAGYKKVKDWKVKLLVSEEVVSCFLLILYMNFIQRESKYNSRCGVASGRRVFSKGGGLTKYFNWTVFLIL